MPYSERNMMMFRTMVSRVYRLSMILVSKKYSNASHEFDSFLEDAMQMMDSSSDVETAMPMDFLNEFLQRTDDEEDGPRIVIHEEDKKHIVVDATLDEQNDHKRIIHVEKITSMEETEEEDEDAEEAEDEEEAEEVEKEEEKTEEVEKAEKKAEATKEEKTEEVEKAEEETEEEIEKAEDEVKKTTDEAEDEVKETAEKVAEDEVKEAAENVAEKEESEEVAKDDADDATKEKAEVAEEEETEEATEEAENAEEAAEEEDEAEEEGLTPIKIGKKMYFLDNSTGNVFTFVSDEEAGDHVGKLKNGKLILE